MTQEEKEQALIEGKTQLALFRGEEIRKVLHEGEWHFSIVDVIEVLTESRTPRRYWSDLKRGLQKEGFSELYEKIVQLKIISEDGKMRETDTADTETLFRIVQSIPSKKAEPFKKWLAKVGYERIKETENPEITIKRAIVTYKAKGYDDEWVAARIQTILSRKEVTREWKNRGIEGVQYAILTDAISMGTFKVTTKQHRELKELKKSHNLRDQMTPLELALTMLGEIATVEITKTLKPRGLKQNKQVAKQGGEVAGKAREDIEERIGRPVLSKDNYLPKRNPKPKPLSP